jgi:hypothetical protein
LRALEKIKEKPTTVWPITRQASCMPFQNDPDSVWTN